MAEAAEADPALQVQWEAEQACLKTQLAVTDASNLTEVRRKDPRRDEWTDTTVYITTEKRKRRRYMPLDRAPSVAAAPIALTLDGVMPRIR